MILTGQLSTELLIVNTIEQKEREERNNQLSKVVQKYREVYSYQVRRQIAVDKLAEDIVINLYGRLRKPYLEYYKWFVQEFLYIFVLQKEDSKFVSTGTLKELLLI